MDPSASMLAPRRLAGVCRSPARTTSKSGPPRYTGNRPSKSLLVSSHSTHPARPGSGSIRASGHASRVEPNSLFSELVIVTATVSLGAVTPLASNFCVRPSWQLPSPLSGRYTLPPEDLVPCVPALPTFLLAPRYLDVSADHTPAAHCASALRSWGLGTASRKGS